MAGGSIFISYRREDTAGESGRLAEHLARRFGRDRVFIDIDAIAPGRDFVSALDRAVTASTIVLVIIGRQWLTVTTAAGQRRLDDPDDFVRREVATALERGARVVPVLVQNTMMPAATALPAPLARLANHQAVAIQHEEFTADTERLADSIAALVAASDLSPAPAWYWRPRTLQVAALIGVLLAGGALVVRQRAAQRAAAAETAARAKRQQAYDNQVTVAQGQFDRDQLAEALDTVERATDAEANGTSTVDTSRGTALSEEIAMRWLRELRVPEGQSRTQAMARPLAVLDRRVPFATGPRRADLLAHLAWATYLRLVDGSAQIRPDAQFEEALTLDLVNPYANAMMGYWLLADTGARDLERARRHFRIAVDAGRATDVVRRFEISALDSVGNQDAAVELIRVIDEMRRRNETLTPGLARAVWHYYYLALRPNGDIQAQALLTAVPPAEHLRTATWAFSQLNAQDSSTDAQLRYWTARLEAAAGDTASARTHLLTLRQEVRDPGLLRSAIDAALAELTRGGRSQP